MAITIVAHTAKVGTSTGCTTTAQNTTGATGIVLGATWLKGSTTPTITSSPSAGTFTERTEYSGAATLTTALWYIASPTTGATQTFTIAGTNIFCPLFMVAFAGSLAASPFDVENGGAGVATLTQQPGSITPNFANEILITTMGKQATTTGNATINGGFSTPDYINSAGGASFGGGMSYLIQTTATAANPTWTTDVTSEMTADIASFQVAAAGGGRTLFVMTGLDGLSMSGIKQFYPSL